MSKFPFALTAILVFSSGSALAHDRSQRQAPVSAPATAYSDPALSSYVRPDQQLGRGAFTTYAPVYRTPGPNTYTYPHGTTVWYGTSVIPVAPAAQPLQPAPFATAPTPVVIHIHRGRGYHH